MNLDNWKNYTNSIDCNESDKGEGSMDRFMILYAIGLSNSEKDCGNHNSLLLQIFIYKNEDISKWNALKLDNDIKALKRMTSKDSFGNRKWGIVDVIIPEQNCEISRIDLSSTDVVNEYRQLLLQGIGKASCFDMCTLVISTRKFQ